MQHETTHPPAALTAQAPAPCTPPVPWEFDRSAARHNLSHRALTARRRHRGQVEALLGRQAPRGVSAARVAAERAGLEGQILRRGAEPVWPVSARGARKPRGHRALCEIPDTRHALLLLLLLLLLLWDFARCPATWTADGIVPCGSVQAPEPLPAERQ